MEILSHLVVAKGSTCNNSFIWRGYSHCPQTIGFSGMSLSDRLPNLYGVYLPCSGMCVCFINRYSVSICSFLLSRSYQYDVIRAIDQNGIYGVLKAQVAFIGEFGDSGTVSYSISLAWEKIKTQNLKYSFYCMQIVFAPL